MEILFGFPAKERTFYYGINSSFRCRRQNGTGDHRSVSERDDCRIAAGIDIHSIDCCYPVFSSPEQCDVACDVIIDFSHPSVTNSLLDYAVKHKIPAVIATTGLSPEQVEQSMRLQNHPCLFLCQHVAGCIPPDRTCKKSC